MSQLSYQTPNVMGFRDRSTMLMVIGILFIIAGAMCGCIAAMMPLAALAPRPAGGAAQQPMSTMIVALLLYASIAAVLITIGIGAIRKRRWVRPIVLVLAWIGLVGGVIGLIMWLIMMPGMSQAMSAGMAAAAPPGGRAPPAPPRALFGVMIVVMTLFMIAIYVVIPAVLIWLFKDASVQATLDFYDRQVRWTDGVPLPVLGLAAILAIGGLWMVIAFAQGWFLAFGMVLTGWSGRIVLAVLALLSMTAAQLVYRRRPAGWWLALILLVIVPLGWLITLFRVDATTLYQAMTMPPEQVRMMEAMNVLSPRMMAVPIAVMTLAAVGYAVYVRKYFIAASTETGGQT